MVQCKKAEQKVRAGHVRFKRSAKPILYRVRIKDGDDALGLLVSSAGKRCIPSTHLWLTADTRAAYRFPHDLALRVQLRLENIGFKTALEKIQD